MGGKKGEPVTEPAPGKTSEIYNVEERERANTEHSKLAHKKEATHIVIAPAKWQ